ncbi:MAG: UvrD-helicase domain-containing protein [Polyangiaceae bacterium]|nr:UvrD-helicase domain-containing protein [Polyangiaceae bacterium]
MGTSTLPDTHSPLSFHTVLNNPQQQAVLHPAGPLLVLAGAGSGKTRVITFRIAHLLAERHVPPYRILAVTFTNKAAREMRDRLAKLVGPQITADLWVGTFHATCARLLRRYHDAVGLRRDYVIYDDADQRALMTRVAKSLGLDDKRFPPKLLLSIVHAHKQQGVPPSDLTISSHADQIVARAYDAYDRQMRSSNAVDFDDLLLHIMRLAEDPDALPGHELRSRFSYVLVDEFQDVNAVQYRLVRALVSQHRELMVVGDDDQSIYRWRGADVRIIRGFQHDFHPARVLKLEQNYRSSGNVVRAALGVIRPSPEREAKELFTENPPGEPIRVVATRDERDEAAFVVKSIRTALLDGLDPGHVAIFYRTHAQSRVLEEAMRSENLPYQIIGGTRFFDRAEVKDLLAYLRVLVNPSSDVDLLRIINVPRRGIGQATIDRIARAANLRHVSLLHVVEHALDDCGLGPPARNRVSAVATLLAHLRTEAAALSPRSLAERVLEVTGYATSLSQDNTAEADARLGNLQELLGSLEEYEAEASAGGEQPSLSGYLERVSLVSDVDQLKEESHVSMMTVHAAKGLEFSMVLLTGAEEDLFPYRSNSMAGDPSQLEEERRLAYVAFTRARHHLVVTYAGSRMIFGSTRYARPSRFLSDIPTEIVNRILSPALASLQQAASHIACASPTTRHTARQPTLPPPARAPGERFIDHDLVDELPTDELQLLPGARVVHSRFGEGQVHAVQTSSSPPVVDVFFPGWGHKKILATLLRPA